MRKIKDEIHIDTGEFQEIWNVDNQQYDPCFYLLTEGGKHAKIIGIQDNECLEQLIEADECVIEQYIERKDRNGREIYEGDIIKAFNGRITGKIIYEKRWSRYGVRQSNGESWGFGSGFLEPKDIEVIGNIHENPELMT